MLDNTKKKLLKLLIALAWADGRVDVEELEVVEAMLDSFGADEQSADEIRKWAGKPRSLDDVDCEGLTEDDAELVLFHAVLLTFIDGEQTAKETDLLEEFVNKIGLSKERAEVVLATATKRAKDLLPVLDA
ncbi:MAG: DUF533 domain-containing protein [Proteobacteria bacterium]|nr:DUF533 domain-containing protein [Pseudomonadota bacterium]